MILETTPSLEHAMTHPSPLEPRFAASLDAPASTRRSSFRARLESLVAVAAGIAPPATRRASAVAGLAASLPGLDEEDYEELPIVCAGERLIPGATYLDLRAVRSGPFPAPVEAYTGEDAWYVAEADVEPALWRRLLRLADGARTR
jgi:hypothetical protein